MEDWMEKNQARQDEMNSSKKSTEGRRGRRNQGAIQP
jgi:hypothetical protein